MTAGAAFKILTAQQWSDWKDACVLHGAPIDLQDGFIHLSAADQVAATAAKHFAGQTGLILAEIDLAQLGPQCVGRRHAAARSFPMSTRRSLFPRSCPPSLWMTAISARRQRSGIYRSCAASMPASSIGLSR